jgi:nucleotidyltransferase/DNA polymerase involved in DNA repair
MIALVDCNNFYASCERVFNPTLNGKPVVVFWRILPNQKSDAL